MTPLRATVRSIDRDLDIEYAWCGDENARPLVVFLHEGLGSLSMWKEFPQRFCAAAGVRGLVYSRPGYGSSTPRAPGERWDARFMHRQAEDVLPAFLAAAGVVAERERPWLFGHSDGGSIALIAAARQPHRYGGIIALAPHIFVEDVSVASIAAAKRTYLETDLRARLARYHDDPDSAFWGWNDVWLDPAFRTWSIEAELAAIRVPVLAIQGRDDEYGTLAQIRGIARHVGHVQLLELLACGHSPHRDRPDEVIAAGSAFLAAARRGDGAVTAPAEPAR